MGDGPDFSPPSHCASGRGKVVPLEIIISHPPTSPSSVLPLITKSMLNAGVRTKQNAWAQQQPGLAVLQLKEPSLPQIPESH